MGRLIPQKREEALYEDYKVTATLMFTNTQKALSLAREYLLTSDIVYFSSVYDMQLRDVLAVLLPGAKIKDSTRGIQVESEFSKQHYWESNLICFFKKLAPVLANNSSLNIYPESDYIRLSVVNGRARLM